MAASAASKLHNTRNPAIHNLLSRQLLRPSAATVAASSNLLQPASTNPNLSDPLFLNLLQAENRRNDLTHDSSDPRNLNIQASNSSSNLQRPFALSGMQIEAARTYVPKPGYEDVDEDVVDDEDDEDDDDYDWDDDDWDDDDEVTRDGDDN